MANVVGCALLALGLASGVLADGLKITEISSPGKLTTLKVNTPRSLPYKVSEIPEILQNLPCVSLPRGSGNNPGPQFSFTINKPATVYLLVHMRGDYAPEGWDKTDMSAHWLVGKGVYNDAIFKKDFPAGKVLVPAHTGRDKGKGPYGVAHLAAIQEK
jgi:hypothetical protein